MDNSKSKQEYIDIINTVHQLTDICKEHINSLKDREIIIEILINGYKTRLNFVKHRTKDIRNNIESCEPLYSFAGDEASNLYIFAKELSEAVERQQNQGEEKKILYRSRAKKAKKKHNKKLLEGDIQKALKELERTISLEDASEKEPESYLKNEGVEEMLSVLNEFEKYIIELENQIDRFEQKVQSMDETDPRY